MREDSTRGIVHEDPVVARINFAGKDVAEIGCGTGDFTLTYLKIARSVLAIDPDSEAIECLKTRWPKSLREPHTDFRSADIVDFPLPEQAFDVVVFSHSF